MDTSGRPREGWMTMVPLAVLIAFVMLALGGPVSFMTVVTNWASDVIEAVMRFFKHL